MKIVVIGAGKVGEELCVCLTSEGHDVVLIEKDTERLEQLVGMADITGVIGNGAIYDTQMEAGVDACDLFIAVSPSDEINIIAAITAKKIGAPYTIARVRDPAYSMQMGFVRESLGISLMINPELEAARDIARIIQFPSALDIEQFDNGRVNIVEVRITEKSSLPGIRLRDLRQHNLDVLVCIIQRGDQIIIPDGSAEIQVGDHVHITGSFEQLNRFYVAAKSYTHRLDSTLIVGGGRITHYLLERLLRQKMRLKVIEVNPGKAEALASEFPDVEVTSGDGTDQAFLREERMTNYDALVALTGIDEENLLLSLFAKREGVKKTITKVNRTDLLKVLDLFDLDSIVTPRKLIADIILRYVRALQNSQGSNVDALYRLVDNKVEALQFHIAHGSRATGKSLKELRLVDNTLLAFIVRDGKLLFPKGNDCMMEKDRVVVVTTHRNFRDIDDILA
ncbi:MAG: Trk system potassium transporter TrkA [Clostridiaceae bacterium]|nr:Trk system potassium transporter TrkA [Clostridiaceae bacterium]